MVYLIMIGFKPEVNHNWLVETHRFVSFVSSFQLEINRCERDCTIANAFFLQNLRGVLRYIPQYEWWLLATDVMQQTDMTGQVLLFEILLLDSEILVEWTCIYHDLPNTHLRSCVYLCVPGQRDGEKEREDEVEWWDCLNVWFTLWRVAWSCRRTCACL